MSVGQSVGMSVSPWKKILWKKFQCEGNIRGKYIIYRNLCHKAHNSGKGVSLIPNATPDGVISAQGLLRRMPFEINIQSLGIS